jgi:hypothetical protein
MGSGPHRKRTPPGLRRHRLRPTHVGGCHGKKY